jgi:hypothetical protein
MTEITIIFVNISAGPLPEARNAIVDMMIDRDDREEYKKTLQERKKF